MNMASIKKEFYELVAGYYPGAMVVWEKTKGVAPKPPYITIGYRNLNRSAFPVNNDDERMYYMYHCTFEINLYTAGRKYNAGNGSYYENTAMDDLKEFILFVDSDGVSDELSKKNISVTFQPPLRDLSELIGNTKFNYRSMAEFEVSYAEVVSGLYGISSVPNVPNTSGGGSQNLYESDIQAIEEVVITE